MKPTLRPLLLSALLMAVFTPAGLHAQAQAPSPNHRPASTVVVVQADGSSKQVKLPDRELLDARGNLTLYPGDRVHLELEEKDGKLINPRVVATVTAPERTITFKMTQQKDITMLQRSTKIQQTVAMDCGNRSGSRDDYSRTNLRPTEQGLAAFDSWPGTVWSLRLSNIEVSNRSADEVYGERVKKP